MLPDLRSSVLVRGVLVLHEPDLVNLDPGVLLEPEDVGDSLLSVRQRNLCLVGVLTLRLVVDYDHPAVGQPQRDVDEEMAGEWNVDTVDREPLGPLLLDREDLVELFQVNVLLAQETLQAGGDDLVRLRNAVLHRRARLLDLPLVRIDTVDVFESHLLEFKQVRLPSLGLDRQEEVGKRLVICISGDGRCGEPPLLTVDVSPLECLFVSGKGADGRI